MVDTQRTKAELLTIFEDGQPPGSIDPQDMRDYVVTTDIANTRFSTSLITGGEVIINGGDNTAIDIAAGTGFYIDNTTDPLNPFPQKVSWSAFLAEAIPVGSQFLTFIGLDLSSGTAVVVLQATNWTPQQRRTIVTLALAIHTGQIEIESIGSDYSFGLDIRPTLTDLSKSLLSINVGGGNIFGPNGANLNIDKSAGSTFGIGSNYQNDKESPNITTDASILVASFFYTYQDGVGGFTNGPDTVLIDPTQWDDGSGTLAAVQTSNTWTTQRIWFFTETATVIIHYGQTEYGTLVDAQADINTEVFVKNFGLVTGFRGWLMVRKGAIDLSLIADAKFIAAGMLGDILRP